MPDENEKKEGNALERTFAVLPVKPRWADALLAGTKKWELRTKPLPLGVPVALYATAPEKKVVGAAEFSWAFYAEDAEGLLKLFHDYWLDPEALGVSRRELEEYLGGRPVFAHRVAWAEALAPDARFELAPAPQGPATVKALLWKDEAWALDAAFGRKGAR